MTKDALSEAELDALFSSARDQDTVPSMALMDRVMSDALAVQALAETTAAPVKPARWWSGALAAIGGWPAMAGLATACVSGIWIGVNPPDMVTDSAYALFSLETDAYLVDVVPGLSLDLLEG